LIPCLIGFVSAWAWRSLTLSTRALALLSLLSTALGLGGAALIFREGAVCLLIISPILYCGVLAGAMSGRTIFRRRDGRMNVFIAPALALLVVAEPQWRTEQTSVVTDEIRIAAPPAKVWPHVLAFETIPDAPNYWLFRLGLPYPVRTTNGGNFVGADRACDFSGGAVFKEKVAELKPERLLTFDIVEQPADPELIGHLDATRGQFELIDNHDGTTTLVGRTWYRLHVRPEFYFDWWTQEIFRAVHLRVMKNVQRLAEAEGGSGKKL
jgi:hypothetical protein